MNLVFRLLAVVVGACFRPRLRPLEESVLTFRVLPNDLDANLHMNNGRYLTLMDLGRVDMMLRLGVLRELFRRRWSPVVGSATVRFRRALAPFQRYELRTRILCWDDRWFFMEQRFTRGGELVAVGVVKAVFTGPEGWVAPQTLVDATGYGHVESPPVPPGIREWQEAEEAFYGRAAAPPPPQRVHAGSA
ncbi:MAG TPA: thioesterase family protein [Longimicrobiaceae bacterium]|nr:thioesterase family protein [Longimicrobiaceae bacterium]